MQISLQKANGKALGMLFVIHTLSLSLYKSSEPFALALISFTKIGFAALPEHLICRRSRVVQHSNPVFERIQDGHISTTVLDLHIVHRNTADIEAQRAGMRSSVEHCDYCRAGVNGRLMDCPTPVEIPSCICYNKTSTPRKLEGTP